MRCVCCEKKEIPSINKFFKVYFCEKCETITREFLGEKINHYEKARSKKYCSFSKENEQFNKK